MGGQRPYWIKERADELFVIVFLDFAHRFPGKANRVIRFPVKRT